jgi:hypothetical protein
MSNNSAPSLRPPQRPDFGADALVFIEKVRKATKRLRAYETNPEDVRGALQAVKNVAGVNVEVPIVGHRREVQMVKTGVKRLVAFYMGYLAGQFNVFSASVVRLGETVASRLEDLERNGDDLAARLGAVEARLGRLEPETAATTPPKRSPRKDAPNED